VSCWSYSPPWKANWNLLSKSSSLSRRFKRWVLFRVTERLPECEVDGAV